MNVTGCVVLITILFICNSCMCCKRKRRENKSTRRSGQKSYLEILEILKEEERMRKHPYNRYCPSHSKCSVGKRSIQDDETDFFGDPCDFNTYDIDENGEISLDELLAISGNNDESKRLFLSLNNGKEDGVITLSEFTEAAPKYIKECIESDKKN
ncbi:uncharacterized protein LOC132751144 [Ruditapes philippinarum]|uniref:uncharacterized protein LOC132751144 n=1 Tax=Ruditapes philippinarum TaxID=129788 RepID=UPI00295AFB15|nr:uncharacterized protein LOC132751144 [Ruditapes philippinarum]